MNIRPAGVDDADRLTMIAFAAKRHWGYPESWIQRWREALTITSDYIAASSMFVAEADGEPVGFCALQIAVSEALLDHLWITPAFMGKGIGRALFQQAEATARASGARRLKITGDPHTEAFYFRMGATLYGREPASMDGVERFLPLLEKWL
jgi:GNAT superfamily N-acetyltransferase